ncbi:MAG: LysM peptidoglycan-binding domain-containing protein [Rikenellaceae bacterium]|nr:LysM peptidoglycan-binding domain-containing protein [Rikenellaceae bacterium]
MKKLICMLNIASLFLVTSCSPYRKVIVKGTPGTVIYKEDGKTQVGTIDSSGATKMKLSAYYRYYLSKAPDSNLKVPFAVDVRDGGMDEGGAIIGAIFGLWVAPITAAICLSSRVDKPLKTQTTNNDLFKGYKAHYQPVSEQQPAMPNTTIKFHKVEKGDTVQSIAKKYGVSPKQIYQLNGLPNPAFAQANLRVGQMLKIR